MKISIIIATYNADKCLQRCLDSIRCQKKDVELLLIDGGSTDSTIDIISRNKDIIDFVLSELDNGIYDAWNKGIKNSHGEWIMFLGADDQLYPDTIENYLLKLEELNLKSSNVDYISANVSYVDENGREFICLGKEWNWNDFSQRMSVAHVASLHNRRLFDQVGLFNIQYKICADYELLLRKKENLKADFIPKRVARMSMGGVSLSTAAVNESFCINSKFVNRNFVRKIFYRINLYAHFYLFMIRIFFWQKV